MTKIHTCYPSSASSKLGIGRDTNVVSKFKPKIRIIHIYDPEIIKTDVANFRELVQRLTGKPEEEGGGINRSKTSLTKDPMDFHPKKAMIMQEDNDEEEFLSVKNWLKVKNENKEEEVEDDIWTPKSNDKFSGNFLEGFSEFDGFMEELGTIP